MPKYGPILATSVFYDPSAESDESATTVQDMCDTIDIENNPGKNVKFLEDFLNGAGTGQMGTTTGGGGVGPALDNFFITAGNNGVVKLRTSTGGAGAYSTLYTGVIRVESNLIFETVIYLDTLADVTQDYRLVLGFSNALGNSTHFTALCFDYDRTLDATYWVMTAASGNVRTQTATTTAVATGWTKLKIVLNDAQDSAEYFINGTSVGTLTTNLPDDTANMQGQIKIVKVAGTTERQFWCDYFYYKMRVTRSV